MQCHQFFQIYLNTTARILQKGSHQHKDQIFSKSVPASTRKEDAEENRDEASATPESQDDKTSTSAANDELSAKKFNKHGRANRRKYQQGFQHT